jgi:sugar lactone lactonase YvrE
MRNATFVGLALSGTLAAGFPLAPVARAQGPVEVTINGTGVQAENLTSSRDGTLYFGSMATGTIYRAAPGAARAEPWILASTAGLTRVLGVFADDRSNTLWVCQNATDARSGAPVTGQTALRAFDLRTGAAKGTYPFPTESGVCNDIAIAPDGTAYASESFRGRIHRLRPGAKALEVWASDSALSVIDGVAVLADGAVYANNFMSGKLYRVPANADGSAGTIVPIETSQPFVRPDGLRSVGPRTLLQAEQQGRVTELTIDGNRAGVRVVRDGLTRPSGVTLVGDRAVVLVDFAKGVVVPYRPGATQPASPPQGFVLPATPPTRAEQEVLDLSKEKWRWMAEKKADTLATLFDDKAIFVHMGGSWGKTQEVEIIRSGGIHYKHAEVFESSARIIDSTAIVLSRIRLDAVVGGREVSNPFAVTEVYVRRNGAWKLASLSFTRLLGE